MIKSINGNSINMMFGTGVSSKKDYEGLLTIIRAAIAGGICGFDTAPSYGTEELLGRCLYQCMDEFHLNRSELFIQTKIDAWQMVEGKYKIRNYVLDVMKKMHTEYLDALLIHWPVPEYMDETWECFSEMKKDGLVRYIGICNVRMRQLEKLIDYDTIPQIIQLERNPLRTCDKEILFCHEHNISVQAYSPLCKMHKDIANSEMLQNLADNHLKNIGQIVLRWHLDTGVIPIFTSKKETRVQEYTDLYDFSLSKEEIEMVFSMNRDYKLYLEACACPGF